MARNNTKYAVYALIGIVVLSLFLYQNSSATGKQIMTTQSQAFIGPAPQQPQPGLVQPSPCDGLQFWQCIWTIGCTWDNVQRKCLSFNQCNNGVWDALETDVDCGGPACAPCDDGDKCQINSDCKSDFCDNVPSKFWNNYAPTFKCKSCNPGPGVPYGGLLGGVADDNIQNCGETGIDCGGQNPYPCHCLDELRNGGEDAVDCDVPADPNPVCDTCRQVPDDTGQLVNLPPHCFDNRLNRGEACRDCGGSCSFLAFSLASKTVPGCCTDEMECVFADFTWCPAKKECYYSWNLPTTECYLTKADCENAGYIWCPAEQKCYRQGLVAPSCFTTQSECDSAGKIYYWCNPEQRCYWDNMAPPLCFENNESCELHYYWWCSEQDECFYVQDSTCYLSKATCEATGYIWCSGAGGVGQCWDQGTYNLLKYVCYDNKADCEGADYYWCSGHNECRISDDGDSSCYATKTDCEDAGFWWCSDKSECFNSKTETCFQSKTTCEANGFWWCSQGTGTCYSGPYPPCISTKTACENAGYYWCAERNTCYYSKCGDCWQTETKCETNSCFWCDKYSSCQRNSHCACFTNQQDCQTPKDATGSDLCTWSATWSECDYA